MKAGFAAALPAVIGLLAGCSSLPGPAERQDTAQKIAVSAGLSPVAIAGSLPLSAYLRQRDAAQPLTLYIEGDGLAWLNRSQPSTDPTPRHPLGLRLAALDPAPNLGWLGRPCQYAGRTAPACNTNALWTEGRFSKAAVTAAMQGIDRLLRPGQKLHLVGYSGGGAIAALVAARRTDVLSLRTIAGNLDHAALTAHHRMTPMTASLNPADTAVALSALPQRHFVGGSDSVVPRLVTDSFLRREAVPAGCTRLQVVPGATHEEGWTEAWPRLMMQPAC